MVAIDSGAPITPGTQLSAFYLQLSAFYLSRNTDFEKLPFL